jgi:hypothetical protein
VAKRIRVSFRMHRVIVIRKGPGCVTGWCPGCVKEASFLTAEQAARVARVTTRVIYQWVEAGRLHIRETAHGETLICLNSLWSLG